MIEHGKDYNFAIEVYHYNCYCRQKLCVMENTIRQDTIVSEVLSTGNDQLKVNYVFTRVQS